MVTGGKECGRREKKVGGERRKMGEGRWKRKGKREERGKIKK